MMSSRVLTSLVLVLALSVAAAAQLDEKAASKQLKGVISNTLKSYKSAAATSLDVMGTGRDAAADAVLQDGYDPSDLDMAVNALHVGLGDLRSDIEDAVQALAEGARDALAAAVR